jgi:hypothetical protein
MVLFRKQGLAAVRCEDKFRVIAKKELWVESPAAGLSVWSRPCLRYVDIAAVTRGTVSTTCDGKDAFGTGSNSNGSACT